MNRCAIATRKHSSRPERVLNQRRRRQTEVRPRRRSRHAAPRGALEEPALEQVGLVDILDRVGLLAHRHRERRQPDGTAAELLADRRQDLAVEAVQAELVDVEHGQRRVRGARGDDAAVAHLGVVAHAPQEPVGDTRRRAGAGRDRARAGGLDLDAQDRRAAPDDDRELLDRVGLEAGLDAEAVAQRRGQQPRARRRADQRERRQLERHHARAGALADGDRQPAVLHGGVEGLLQRAVEPVDLVDEEHRARLERGEEGGDVALALERRARRLHERHLELAGDDLGQRRLAQPGRAGEQQVIERVAARARRLDGDRELLLEAILADELLKPPRAQRDVELVLDQLDRRLDPRAGQAARPRGSPVIGVRAATAWLPGSSLPGPAQRRRDQVLRALALGCVEQRLGLGQAVAQLDQAVARQRARVVAARDGDRARRIGGRRRADLLAQLDDDALRRALADPGHGLEALGVARGDRGEQLARRAARQHGQRHLRPDRLDAEQQQEQVALLLAAEAEQRDRVVAQDRVRVQRDVLADRRHAAQRLGRHGEPVADAAGEDDDVVGPPDGDLAAHQRDHAATSPTWLTWQIATASASAAWSGRGGSGSESSVWTIRPTWSLSARPVPHTAPLTCWGV